MSAGTCNSSHLPIPAALRGRWPLQLRVRAAQRPLRRAAAVAERHTIDLARLKAELEAQDEEIRQLRELQQQMETAVAYAYYAAGKEHGQQEALAQQANAAAAATD